jgi:hypothetical protein
MIKNDWLISVIGDLESQEFYGKIVINFCRGDVSTINKEESILKPQKPKDSSLKDS